MHRPLSEDSDKFPEGGTSSYILHLSAGVQVVERVGVGRLQLAEGGLLRVPGGRGQRGRREPRQEVRRLPQGPQPQWLSGEPDFLKRYWHEMNIF